MKSLHPGFKAVQKKIAERSGVSEEKAGAILASRSRNASASAKRKNPRLKRVLGIILLGMLTMPSVMRAQNLTNRFFANYNHETLTITNSVAVSFTSSLITPTCSTLGCTPPPGAELASVTVECATGTSCPTRIIADGTTATSSVGQIVDYEYSFLVYGHQNIVRFSAFNTSTTNSIFQVVYAR